MRKLLAGLTLALTGVGTAACSSDNPPAPPGITTPGRASESSVGMLAFEVTGTGDVLAITYSLTNAPNSSGGRMLGETVPQPTLPWRTTMSVATADLGSARAELTVTPIIGTTTPVTLRVLLGERVVSEKTSSSGLQDVTMATGLSG